MLLSTVGQKVQLHTTIHACSSTETGFNVDAGSYTVSTAAMIRPTADLADSCSAALVNRGVQPSAPGSNTFHQVARTPPIKAFQFICQI